MRYVFGLILTTLLLTGCVPLWGSYYRPFSDGAIEKHLSCRDSNGPITRVSLEAGTGLLTFSASRNDKNQKLINIRLEFEPDWVWEKTGSFTVRYLQKADQSTLSIATNEIEVRLPNSSIVLKPTLTGVTSYTIFTNRKTQLPLQQKLELAARRRTDDLQSIYYWIDFNLELSNENEKEFTVVIPEFAVDGSKFKSRTVRFVEEWDIWISPLNGC